MSDEEAKNGSPADRNQDKAPQQPREQANGDIVHGDKIGGDVVAGDKITAAGDYVARQIIVQSTTVASIEHQPPEAGDPPFKGLQYFTAADAHLFFGREDLVARLAGRLHDTDFLVVIGASGSGKSSVVRAGLIPAMESQEKLADGSLPPAGQWETILLTPTERPLDSLAAAIFPTADQLTERIALRQKLDGDEPVLPGELRTRSENDPLWRGLLVVDQFEEIFTLCKDEEQRERFLANLLGSSSDDALPAKLLLVIRSDFYTNCLEHDVLRPLLEQHQAIVGAMDRSELRKAILEPLAVEGWSIQEGLARLILDEVSGEPGALPLLSHALLETWLRRRGRTLTLSGYQEAGGVRGAIAKTAETLYTTKLGGDEQQHLAEHIFLELVQPGEDARDTRRRITIDQIHVPEADPSDVEALLNTLIAARLITVDQAAGEQSQTIEVAHEALIREWPRLQEWLDENRDELRFLRRLENDVKLWEENDHDSEYLYSGARLARLAESGIDQNREVDDASQAFIDASFALERSRRRRRYALIGLAAIVALLIIFLGQRAWTSEQRARQGRLAELTQRAQALALNSEGLRQTQPELATLLAIQASHLNELGGQPVTWLIDRTLRGSLGFGFNNIWHSELDPLDQLVFHADGQQLWSTGSDDRGRIQLQSWDLNSPDRQSTPWPESGRDIAAIDGACFSERIALVDNEGTARLWNPYTAQFTSLAAPEGPQFWTDVALSPDGRFLAAASDFGPIYLWRTTNPSAAPLRLPGHADSFVWALAFTADGEQLVSAGDDGRLLFWSTSAPDAPPVELVEQNGWAWHAVATSADGRYLAAADEVGFVFFWDMSLPQPVGGNIGKHDWDASDVAFSADSRYLASSSSDGNIFLWEIVRLSTNLNNEIPTILQGQEDGIQAIEFACSDNRLASLAGDRTVRVWQLDNNLARPRVLSEAKREGAVLADLNPVTDLKFGSDGHSLISAGSGGQIVQWPSLDQPSEPVILVEPNSAPGSVVLDERAQTAAFLGEDGSLQVNSITDDNMRLQTTVPEYPSWPVLDLSADGERLAVSAGQRPYQVLYWDFSAGINDWLLAEQETIINQVLFDPQERWLATANDGGMITLYPLQDQEASPLELAGHDNPVEKLSFSSDGRFLASGGTGNLILIWDLNDLSLPPQRLEGHQDNITALAFSPDGHHLASSALRGPVLIWELDSLTEPIVLTESGFDSGDVRHLDFSPDGRFLAGGTNDGRVVVWPTLEALVEIGCQAVGRNLSAEEWQLYLADELYCPVCPEMVDDDSSAPLNEYDASCVPVP